MENAILMLLEMRATNIIFQWHNIIKIGTGEITWNDGKDCYKIHYQYYKFIASSEISIFIPKFSGYNYTNKLENRHVTITVQVTNGIFLVTLHN